MQIPNWVLTNGDQLKGGFISALTGLSTLSFAAFTGLFIIASFFKFTIKPLSSHFLLQLAQSLIDIIINDFNFQTAQTYSPPSNGIDILSHGRLN